VEAPALTGRLLRDRVAVGSKSEREALLLEADDGGLYVVRRRGAPTWGEEDAALGRLVGRRVALTGSVVEGTVLVDDCEPLDEPA
jgi:hypothetical protein